MHNQMCRVQCKYKTRGRTTYGPSFPATYVYKCDCCGQVWSKRWGGKRIAMPPIRFEEVIEGRPTGKLRTLEVSK